MAPSCLAVWPVDLRSTLVKEVWELRGLMQVLHAGCVGATFDLSVNVVPGQSFTIHKCQVSCLASVVANRGLQLPQLFFHVPDSRPLLTASVLFVLFLCNLLLLTF